MPLSLSSDIASLRMHRNLISSTSALRTSMQRLSTGLRINNASDGAANLALSTKLETQFSGLDVANNNIKTALGKLYTFEGYIKGVTEDLHSIRDLAVQSANSVYGSNERTALNSHVSEVKNEITQAQTNGNSELPADKAGFIDDINQIDEAQALLDGYDLNHIISSASEFVSKLNSDLNGDFILTSDVDLSELGTLTSSVITSTFTGKLDGNGYSLKNLDIEHSSTGSSAVFSQTNGATIKNLGVKNVSINAANGGRVAALVGVAINTSVSNSFSEGTIIGDNVVAGLVAKLQSNSEIINCSSGVAVSGIYQAGGLISSIESSTVSNSYSTGNVSIPSSAIGGAGGLAVVAFNSSTIDNCYATGNVSGNERAGGLLGRIQDSSISNSYSTGDVFGSEDIGGFIGYSTDSSINNSYATGNVEASDNVGGFGGLITGTSVITNSYSSGLVSGITDVGGFTGVKIVSASVDSSNYWDTTKSGLSSSDCSAQGVNTSTLQALIDAGTVGTPEYTHKTAFGGGDLSVHVGSNEDDIYTLSGLALSLDLSGLDISTSAKALASIDIIDNLIEEVTSKAAYVGAGSSTLEQMMQSNAVRSQNLEETNSRIRDTDMAYETAQMTKQQILQQASMSLLSQNQGARSGLLLTLLGAG